MSRRPTLAGVRSWRRGAAAVALLTLAALGVLSSCSPPPPVSLASTGDSIARGFDACGLLSDCPGMSYATGNDPSSASMYRRLLPSSPGLAGHQYNNAEVGARASELLWQMSLAVAQKADVVTVMIGANDVCASSLDKMTPALEFRSQIATAFAYFFSHRPTAKMVVSSIPNVYRVWEVAHNNAQARAVWEAVGLCRTMLAHPASTARNDQLRRVFVALQIDKLNQYLQTTCEAYRNCKWDGGAVTRYPFTLSQLSTWDYFHPNAAGQRVLADIAWRTFNS